ncbi:hypothetical protein GCM10010302_13180 [Streptomyces polychromogenes]|uniref:Uncharacterized protein n=1 Tax=Streptomyces polychromogenes TaxID=67342 RepID=A0ABN0V645_9ACTN
MRQSHIDPRPDIRHQSEAAHRVAATIEPSSDLLDRAQAGWERFLDSCEEARDE